MKRVVLFCLLSASCAPQDPPRAEAEKEIPYCESPRRIAGLPAVLFEASGIAVSRRHPDILWAHNDSGEPVLFAVDTLGELRGKVTLDVGNADWEDIAVGDCAGGSCLYIGATGDNRQSRSDRVIYRLREPALEGTARVEARFRYRLPEGPQDIEAVFVLPGERIYLVTKGRSGPITMFAFPAAPSTSGVNVLEPVQSLTTGLVQLPDMITGAGATRDGKTIVMRTYSALQLYSFENQQLSPLLHTSGFDLQPLREPQGEGVDISANGTVYLISEKGLEDEAAPLSRVSCVLSAR